MHPAIRRAAGAALLALGGSAPLAAQETIHWPLRTHAGPTAMAEGAAAPFWNPAGMAALTGRGAALVVDSRSPSAVGVSGLALGGAYAVRPGAWVGVAFRHVGIDGIDRTTDSPLPDPGGDALAAAEDHFHVAAAWAPRVDVAVGASVRYARTSELLGGDSQAGALLGARWSPTLPLRPVLGVTAGLERNEMAWSAAARVRAPLPAALADWAVHTEYGVRHAPAIDGQVQRLLATASWLERAALSIGAAGEPDNGGTGWRLVAGGSVSLGRYTLGLVREGLAGGFGAAHTFRLNVDF
ncbi:MAG: hypothetical protein WEB88_11470 [Gemmatimonadota bacterium]